MKLNRASLQEILFEKADLYNRPTFIEADPISIPHLFTTAADIEIAGFLTATIAWGQRKSLIQNARELMRRMDFAPHDFIVHHTYKERVRFGSFVHRTFNGEAKIKLTQLVNEGMGVLQEIEDLTVGLNETIKAIAEELEIKPGTLKKAVKIAYKAKLGETNRDHDELNTILETVGKTL